MRLSKAFIPTVKEIPNDAIIPSHQLMIRAGMVRLLAAGIYSWLPLGYKVMKKVCEIVREEMDAIGGQEFHLPALNPIELWDETGRVKAFGDNLFHVKNRPLVLAPTHEEVICWIAKNHVESYKDMPQIWYQIQTKFRNEPRPRSGVLRGRQFLMKDSYTLDATWDGLDKGYDLHAEAYKKIFTRCGLKFFIVGASSGAMGGSGSQEFMLESDSGEDTIALAEDNSYAANLEIATSVVTKAVRHAESKPLDEIPTPNVKTIDELAAFLKVDHSVLAKSVVYWADKTPVLVLLMGNDELNESKLTSVMGTDVRPIEAESLFGLTGADGGSIGPVGLKGFKVIADKRLEGANGLISGANRNDYHLKNIDLQRDCKIDGYYDLRTVQAGETAPNGTAKLRIVRGIELGHIFKLGTKYSDSLKATYLDERGEAKPIIMGSYGIGIERIIACHIEQNHDANGIIWDKSIAPYLVHIVAVNVKNKEVVERAEHLYNELLGAGIDTLYDDRPTTPGFKFKDADLLGMPLQVIVGEKNLANSKIEVKIRKSGERILVDVDQSFAKVKELLI
ncbi:MAG: proline--tRNA ligase [Bacteroidetes bacterium]|nr:proline--tRNA ligase [Bacteroidota bacterium]MCW5896068.1 proline--tRNA ligase [Bacteroidota bacterium]